MVTFGVVVSSALCMWKCIQIFLNNESPMVVVLSGSMEPSMYRGDILVLQKRDDLAIGDVIVYQIESEKIPIVHRVASLQEVPRTEKEMKEKPWASKTKIMFMTKGDNNPVDDRGLYPKGVAYLDETSVVGHVYANIPYSGYLTLLVNDYPAVKYSLIGFMLLTSLVSKDQA